MNDLFGGQLASSVSASTVQSALRVGSSLFPPVAGVSSKARESVSDGSKNRVSDSREASPWYCRLVKTTMPQQSIQNLIGEGLDTKTVLRAALELAAQEIEKQAGNPMYAAAFKKSAAKVRALKPD